MRRSLFRFDKGLIGTSAPSRGRLYFDVMG
jgi:hypothetical protein